MRNIKLIKKQIKDDRRDLAVINLIVSNYKISSLKLIVKWVRFIDPSINPFSTIRNIVTDSYYMEAQR